MVKVYLDEGGERRLIGHADLPEDCGPLYEVALFGSGAIISENFTVGTATHMPEDGGAPVVERAVLVASDQLIELLPGWKPLAS